ncbi:ubiquitin-activating enzyme E1 [Fusarium oxysporum]|nr:ubiquitin-activating enzyme E1 [Fusarium oxysporum]
MSYASPWHLDFRANKGWRFATPADTDAEGENVVPDPLHDSFTHLRQAYFETDPNYAARFSVPVLYDKINRVIVNNESSEILRMFGTECGSASSQEAYDEDVTTLFRALHKVEAYLATSSGSYWLGDKISERPQPVYTYHFKCNVRDIRSDTTNFLHIKNHYTRSHTNINPSAMTAAGPSPNILGLGGDVTVVKSATK